MEKEDTLSFSSLLLKLIKTLEKYIKKDEITKLSVFFTALSAYTNEPINLFLKGESGIGKTYNTVQALRFFPKEDVWFLGGMSPKAIIHEYGELYYDDGTKVGENEKPEKPLRKNFSDDFEYQKALQEYKAELKAWKEKMKNVYTLVDLRRKILVFLESPSRETYDTLLPILSHDKEEIEYKFVNKSEKGLRTERVKIRGFPACIFLTTDKSYLEDLATRSFTATPEFSKEKIEEAQKLINESASFPWEQKEDEDDKFFKDLILKIRENSPNEVIIPFPNLYEAFPKDVVRDMRDFQHFCQFVKAITLLHFFERLRVRIGYKVYIVSTAEDILNAFSIYSKIFETTRTGTEERILKLYNEIIVKKEGWYIKDIVDEWNKISTKKVSRDWVEKALKRLLELGYVDSEPDPDDRRRIIYRPLQPENSELRRKLENRRILMDLMEKGAKISYKKISDAGPQFLQLKNSTSVLTIDEQKFLDYVLGKTTNVEMKEEQKVLPEPSQSVKLVNSEEKEVNKLTSEKIFFCREEGSASDFFSYEKFAEKVAVDEKNLPKTEKTANFGEFGKKSEKISINCFECKYCGILFATQQDLMVHMNSCHKFERFDERKKEDGKNV